MFKYLKITTVAVLSIFISTLSYSNEIRQDDHSSFVVENQRQQKHHKRYSIVMDGNHHRQSRDFLKSHANYEGTFVAAPKVPALPTSWDLRQYCPPVYDQGQLGSCTANAIAGAMQTDMAIEKKTPFVPSRLFIYYNERSLEGSVYTDSGASLSDGLRVICTTGACHESLWPYVDSGNKFAQKPSTNCYTDAKTNVDLDNLRLASVGQDLISLKTVLSSNIPVVFGFLVFSSFESSKVASTGIVPIPNTKKESYLGGHAVMLAGYDDRTQQFLVRNSWGTSWGQRGYFWMPYAYVTSSSLAFDFWKINKVGATK